MIPVISFVLGETTLTISDSIDGPVSMESEIVRVISRSTTEISEITRLKIRSPVSDTLTHYQTTNFRRFQTERVCRRQF